MKIIREVIEIRRKNMEPLLAWNYFIGYREIEVPFKPSKSKVA